MGNTQSVEGSPAQRPAQRLVKPRTGSGSVSGLLSPNGFSSSTLLFNSPRLNAPLPERPSPPVPSPEATVTTSPSTEDSTPSSESRKNFQPASEAAPRVGRRRSLFRSKSSQDQSREREKRSSSIGASLSRVGEKAMGRANSMTYESAIHSFYKGQPNESRPVAVSRASWAYNMTSYEAKRLLIPDEPLNADDEPRSERFNMAAPSRWRSPSPAQHTSQSASTTISRANSDVSLCIPARRRSLVQVPGVATRPRGTSAVRQPSSVRHSHPPTPSMSRQPSFNSETGRVLSLPPRLFDTDSMPRVVTPCDAEYQSIGAFKLGSLRITNGTASPSSPEIERTRKHGPNASSETRTDKTDYFSKEKLSPTPPPKDHLVPPVPAAAAQPANLEVVQPSSLVRQLEDSLVGSHSDNSGESPAAASEGSSAEQLPEIKMSLFSLDGLLPAGQNLLATSKASAVEDQLFDDEGTAEHPAPEVLDVRPDSNAKREANRTPDSSSRDALAMRRTDSGIVTSPVSDYSHKTLTKADSGYSSNVSLRSFQSAKAGVSKDPRRSSFEKARLQDGRRRLSTGNSEPHRAGQALMAAPEQPLTSADRTLRPAVPPKDRSSDSRQDTPPPRVDSPLPAPKAFRHSLPGISRKPVNVPSPIITAQTPSKSPRSPDSNPQTPLSAKSDASMSALSIGSGSNRPSMLQRLLSGTRRLSNGPPAVHVIHEFDKAGIPSVPPQIEAKLHEHNGMFPMSTKRLALKRQGSKDTLKTIFSVGSLEIAKDDLLPPLPPLPDGILESHSGQNADAHPRPSPTEGSKMATSPVAFLIPRKPIARKPLPSSPLKARDEFAGAAAAAEDSLLPQEAELATYTVLNSALGNNPYDAARVAMASGGRKHNRTMSMTVQLERGLAMDTVGPLSESPRMLSSPISPPLPSPSVAPLSKSNRTPPPVSMRTRRSWNSRPMPPKRPSSTPVGLAGRPVLGDPGYGYSQSYQGPRGPNVDAASLVKDAAPPIPPMHPRRSIELQRPLASSLDAQPRSSLSRTPSWDVRTDHDVPRRPSGPDPRCNSLSAISMRRQSASPSLVVPRQPPRLKHRASYDGFGAAPRYGNLQHAPQDSRGDPPFPTGNMSLPYDPTSFEWNSGSGRYPLSVPRRSARHSMGPTTGPNQPPYRILHSYNSPAYRNVPIWN